MTDPRRDVAERPTKRERVASKLESLAGRAVANPYAIEVIEEAAALLRSREPEPDALERWRDAAIQAKDDLRDIEAAFRDAEGWPQCPIGPGTVFAVWTSPAVTMRWIEDMERGDGKNTATRRTMSDSPTGETLERDPEKGTANCGGCDWTYAGAKPKREAMRHLNETGHAVGWQPWVIRAEPIGADRPERGAGGPRLPQMVAQQRERLRMEAEREAAVGAAPEPEPASEGEGWSWIGSLSDPPASEPAESEGVARLGACGQGHRWRQMRLPDSTWTPSVCPDCRKAVEGEPDRCVDCGNGRHWHTLYDACKEFRAAPSPETGEEWTEATEQARRHIERLADYFSGADWRNIPPARTRVEQVVNVIEADFRAATRPTEPEVSHG